MPGHKARWLAGQPFDKSPQAFITEQVVAIVVGQRQLLFAEQPVNLVVAGTADPECGADALAFAEALLHINLVMQCFRDQMMARQSGRASAELAGIRLLGQTNRFRHTGSAGLAFTAQAQTVAQWQQGQVNTRIITQRQIERLNRSGVSALRVILKHAPAP